MSIPVDWLIFLISSAACIYLCFKWRKDSSDKKEPTIALIGAVTTVILFFFNECNNKKQSEELISIHQHQISELQDTLKEQIRSLKIDNDSISKKLKACQNQSSDVQQIGNENSSVNGNNNTVITGNDSSTIIINHSETPFFKGDVKVEGLLNTHIKIRKGDKVFISATGSIKVGPIAGYSGPDGKEGGLFNASLEKWNIVPSFKHAALMFKLNQDESWIECGSSFKFTSDQDGELIFQINDKKQSDNIGAYPVSVEIYR